MKRVLEWLSIRRRYWIYRVDLWIAKRIAWRYLIYEQGMGRPDWELHRFFIMAHDLYAVGACRPVIVTRGTWFIIGPRNKEQRPTHFPYDPSPSVKKRLRRLERQISEYEATRIDGHHWKDPKSGIE